MFGLSATTGYAIQALSCLEGDEDRLVQANEIADHTGIPRPYLSKIMHNLGKAGLIRTKRGYRGGFALARAADDISLFDIAQAIEGDTCLSRCLLGLAECSDERACPVHEFWKVERTRIEARLKSMKLHAIAAFEKRHGRLSSALTHAQSDAHSDAQSHTASGAPSNANTDEASTLVDRDSSSASTSPGGGESSSPPSANGKARSS